MNDNKNYDLDVLVVAFFVATLLFLGSAMAAILGYVGTDWVVAFFLMALVLIGASRMPVD
jgi:hypothetical protein